MERTGYTTHQISKICSVSVPTIISWIKQEKLLSFKTLGGHNRVKKENLIHFLKQNNIPLPEELKEIESKRVLIVDDEKNVIEAVKLMLEDFEIEIETATNGITAGIELTQFKPHLVIVDASMPGADGDVVCKAIKENKALQKIKILVFTGYPGEGKKLLRLGADKLIIKASKETDPEPFRKEVCKLLGIKYVKVLQGI